MLFMLSTIDARFGNVDLEFAFVQGIGVEHADRLFCFGLLGHRYEGEAF